MAVLWRAMEHALDKGALSQEGWGTDQPLDTTGSGYLQQPPAPPTEEEYFIKAKDVS